MSDRSKNVLAFAALVGIAAIASSRNLPEPANATLQTAAFSASAGPLVQISVTR